MKSVFCVAVAFLFFASGFAPTGFAYMPESGEVKLCIPSPDGKKIATTQFGEPVRIWDIETGKELQKFHVADEDNDTNRLYGNSSRAHSLTFTPDGKKIVILHQGVTCFLDIWEIETGKKVQTLKGDEGDTEYLRVGSRVFSPDNKRVVAVRENKIINIWDIESGEVLQKMDGLDKFLDSGSLAPDGTKRVTLSRRNEDLTAVIWDVQSGKELRILQLSPDEGKAFPGTFEAFFSPDGRKVLTVATVRYGHIFRIWEADSGTMLQKVEVDARGTQAQVFRASFLPDGKRIITAYGDDIRIWDADTGKMLKKVELQGLYRERQQ